MRLIPLLLLLTFPAFASGAEPVVRVEPFTTTGPGPASLADDLRAAVVDEVSLSRVVRVAAEDGSPRFVVRGQIRIEPRVVEARVVVTDTASGRPLPPVVASAAPDQLPQLRRELASGVRWAVERGIRRDGETQASPPAASDVRPQPRPSPTATDPVFTPAWLDPVRGTDRAETRAAQLRTFGTPPRGPWLVYSPIILYHPRCFFRGW